MYTHEMFFLNISEVIAKTNDREQSNDFVDRVPRGKHNAFCLYICMYSTICIRSLNY